jgi:hypothetical protein
MMGLVMPAVQAGVGCVLPIVQAGVGSVLPLYWMVGYVLATIQA